MLYKITFAFKSRQGVDKFIRGANWLWLKYTVTLLYRRPREIASLNREHLPSGQSSGRNRRMNKRSDRRWRKIWSNEMRQERRWRWGWWRRRCWRRWWWRWR